MGRRSIAFIALLFMLAGCSLHLRGGGSNSTAQATPRPAGLVANTWVQQSFPGLAGVESGTVAFVANQSAVGYACVNSTALDASATPNPATSTAANFFTTLDTGQTWSAIHAPGGSAVMCASSALLAPESGNPADLFLLANAASLGALHTVNPTSQTTLRLLRSQDGGLSWQPLTLPAPARLAAGLSLGLNPAHLTLAVNASHLLLGTATVGVGGALYASADAGQSWAATTSPDGGQSTIVATAPGPAGTMLALAGPSLGSVAPRSVLTLWQTSDAVHWRAVASLAAVTAHDPATTPYLGITLIASPNAKTLVALEVAPIAAGSASPSRLLRSVNGGVTWQALPTLTSNQANGPYDLSLATVQGTIAAATDDGRVWVQPNDAHHLSDSTGVAPGLFVLADSAGATWVNLTPAPAAQYIAQPMLVVDSAPHQVILWTTFTASDPDPTWSGIYHYVYTGV